MSNSVINFNAPQYAEAAIAAQHATQIIRSITDQIDRLELITLESPHGTLIGVGLAKGSEYPRLQPLNPGGLISNATDRLGGQILGKPKGDTARATANTLLAPHLPIPRSDTLRPSALCSHSYDEPTHYTQDDFPLAQTTDTQVFHRSPLDSLVSNAAEGLDGQILGKTEGDTARATVDAHLAPHSPISRLDTPQPSALGSLSYDESACPPTNEFQWMHTSDHHPFSCLLHSALASDTTEGQDGRILNETQAIIQQGDTVPAAVDGPLAPHSSNPHSIALCPSASCSLPYDEIKKHSLDDEPRLHPSDYDAIANHMPYGEIDSDAVEGWVACTLDKARKGELTSQCNAAAQEVAQTTADRPLTVCSLDDCPIAVCSLDDCPIAVHSLDNHPITVRSLDDRPIAARSLKAHPLTTGSPNSCLLPSNTTTDSMQVDTIHIHTSDFDSTMEHSLHSNIDSDAAKGRIMRIAQHKF
ncbi:hypothetical protein BDZ97DRAFT_1922375 [Flammula alnicola]|nr:hypothetical protein BDZ97DRAFT_1922375 [Flammula alnicola]